ncbi:MAG: type I 3-dehydroquinate dehydratase [Clostridia bacterium]|nr:type I 3-dehydroquinate dehydratase [Clostridia bacterium]MBQ9801987.1 type I 3-dehydroquinate dehydratase [Clostridia bacterium]
MKATFLSKEQPMLTTMVQANTPDEVIALIGRAIPAGAEALGIQTCRFAPELQTEETYKRIFAAAKGLPTYVTHYRGRGNEGKSEDELAAGMLEIAAAGATLVDVMGDLFCPHTDELTDNPRAVRKQKKLIKELHERGAEVLMSSHTHKYLPPARILEIALAQQARGADIVKIVTKADYPEQEIELMATSLLLKKHLKVPFLLLCGENHRIIRRIGPMLGSCMWLCVLEYDECATKAQPLLADVKAIREKFE